MSALDLALYAIALIMACIGSFNLGQILVWLLIPQTLIISVEHKNGTESAERKVRLFRIYRPHAQLLELIDQAKTKAQQSRGTYER